MFETRYDLSIAIERGLAPMARTAPLPASVCPFQVIPDPVARNAAIQAAGYRGWDGTCPQGFLFEQGMFLKPSEWLNLISPESTH
jgi:hypothetical protein